MNKTSDEVVKFFETFKTVAPDGYKNQAQMELMIAPVAVYLREAVKAAEGTGITVAAQNCHSAESGAYTGEVALGMLKDLGVEMVIVGHSERRQYFNDTDKAVADKVMACLQQGVRPVLCVGESLAEREGGQTESVLERQLSAFLDDASDIGSLVIAYEPVWAIGTGLTATDDQAQQAHKFIRSLVSKKVNATAGQQVQILYGGSVKPTNVRGLLAQPDIDGALIGGASLKPEDFAAIVSEGLASIG